MSSFTYSPGAGVFTGSMNAGTPLQQAFPVGSAFVGPNVSEDLVQGLQPWKGERTDLGVAIYGIMNRNYGDIIGRLFPISEQGYNIEKIVWNTMELPNTEPSPVGIGASVRRFGVSYEQKSARFKSKGLGFDFEYRWLQTADGETQFQMFLAHLAMCIYFRILGDGLNVVVDEYNAKNNSFVVQSGKYGSDPLSMYKKIVEFEVQCWAAAHVGRALSLLQMLRTQILRFTNGQADTLVMTEHTKALVTAVHSSETDYYLGGQPAVDARNGGPDAVNNLTGTPIITAPDTGKLGNPQNPLNTWREIGEKWHFRDELRGKLLGTNGNTRYYSALRAKAVYDSVTREYREVTLLDCIENSGRYDEHGRAVNPTEYAPTSTDDIFLWTKPDGTPQTVRYYGNFRNLGVEDYYEMSRTLLSSFSASCGVSEAVSVNMLSFESRSIIKILEDVPFNEEFFEALVQENGTSFANDAETANIPIRDWVRPNQNGSLVLPSITGIVRITSKLPIGFANWSGLEQISAEVNTGSWSSKGYDESFGRRVAEWCKFFRRFVDFLCAICKDHPLVSPVNLPQNIINPDEYHAVFVNLIQPLQRFNLYLKGSSSHSGPGSDDDFSSPSFGKKSKEAKKSKSSKKPFNGGTFANVDTANLNTKSSEAVEDVIKRMLQNINEKKEEPDEQKKLIEQFEQFLSALDFKKNENDRELKFDDDNDKTIKFNVEELSNDEPPEVRIEARFAQVGKGKPKSFDNKNGPDVSSYLQKKLSNMFSAAENLSNRDEIKSKSGLVNILGKISKSASNIDELVGAISLKLWTLNFLTNISRVQIKRGKHNSSDYLKHFAQVIEGHAITWGNNAPQLDDFIKTLRNAEGEFKMSSAFWQQTSRTLAGIYETITDELNQLQTMNSASESEVKSGELKGSDVDEELYFTTLTWSPKLAEEIAKHSNAGKTLTATPSTMHNPFVPATKHQLRVFATQSGLPKISREHMSEVYEPALIQTKMVSQSVLSGDHFAHHHRAGDNHMSPDVYPTVSVVKNKSTNAPHVVKQPRERVRSSQPSYIGTPYSSGGGGGVKRVKTLTDLKKKAPTTTTMRSTFSGSHVDSYLQTNLPGIARLDMAYTDADDELTHAVEDIKFKELLYNIWTNTADKCIQTLSSFFVLCTNNLQTIRNMWKNNIVLPFDGIAFRPFMLYPTEMAFAAQSGGVTGRTFVQPVQVIQHNDGMHRIIHVDATTQYVTVVKENRNLVHYPNVSVGKPISGCGVSFFTPEDRAENLTTLKQRGHSLFGVIVPRGTEADNYLDVTGEFSHLTASGLQRIGDSRYPGCEFFRAYWKFNRDNLRMPQTRVIGNGDKLPNSSFYFTNTIVHDGPYIKPSMGNSGTVEYETKNLITGSGHWSKIPHTSNEAGVRSGDYVSLSNVGSSWSR
jgi:hypothetical protein